jgi:hypothetical protein
LTEVEILCKIADKLPGGKRRKPAGPERFSVNGYGNKGLLTQ